jgi:hypothetical protein
MPTLPWALPARTPAAWHEFRTGILSLDDEPSVAIAKGAALMGKINRPVAPGEPVLKERGMDSDSQTLREMAEKALPPAPHQKYGDAIRDPILADLLDRFTTDLLELEGTRSELRKDQQKKLVFRLCETSRDAILHIWPPVSTPPVQVRETIQLFRRAVSAIWSEDPLVVEFRENIAQRAKELEEELALKVPDMPR